MVGVDDVIVLVKSTSLGPRVRAVIDKLAFVTRTRVHETVSGQCGVHGASVPARAVLANKFVVELAMAVPALVTLFTFKCVLMVHALK